MTRMSRAPFVYLFLVVVGCGSAGDTAPEETADTAVATDTTTLDTFVATEDVATDTATAPEVTTDVAPSDTKVDPLAGSVLVYTLNIENMIFDWKDVVHVMKREPRNVDVLLVQQMTNRKRLDELADFMTARLGEKYVGVVAQNTPTDNRFAGEVIPRPSVTTGVLWRAARFKYVSHETWYPWGSGDGSGGHTCDRRASHSGYETIRVRLEDTLAKKMVVAASLRHWTWMDCSQLNMLEMIDGVKTGGAAHDPMPDAALQLVGGDFNGPAFDASGDYKCWYKVTVSGLGGDVCASHPNLGFGDPIYDKCKGDKACVKAESGIDFIFGRVAGKKPARSSGYDIISYADGDAADKAETGSDELSNRTATDGFNDVTSNYSEHRARRALFFYE